MKTEITRVALLGLIAGMVVIPSLTRGLTSDACGKERKAYPPIELTGNCAWEGRCTITTLDPPNYFCGNPAAQGHYCQNLNEQGEKCTQDSMMTVQDGVCASQAGGWRCIDIGNPPWSKTKDTAIVPCYEGVDFELCPPPN